MTAAVFTVGAVLFDTDEAAIKAEFAPVIDKLAADLSKRGGGTVGIVGHADKRASDAYNVALGAINRAMPQMMVAFVGAPAITAAGLLILMLSAPVILHFWGVRLDRLIADPLAMPR